MYGVELCLPLTRYNGLSYREKYAVVRLLSEQNNPLLNSFIWTLVNEQDTSAD